MILTKLLKAVLDGPVRRRPRDKRALERLALRLTGTGRMSDALVHFRAAQAISPLSGSALESFVRVLCAHSEHEEGVRAAEEAVAAYPHDVDAWFALGLAYQAAHCYADALRCHDAALARGADAARLHAGRGIALANLGRLDEALAAFDRALEDAPLDALARFHRSLVLLARGDYAQGWPGYEIRLASAVDAPRRVGLPRWDGGHLDGRTLLVRGEQGLGDEIMFASCIPDLIRTGARLSIECNPVLEPLFARSFPEAHVRAAGGSPEAPAGDVEIPIGSLALLFRGDIADFPRHGGYLRADPARVAHWRGRLDALGPGLKVGISWRGGTHATRAALRSIPLEAWQPIFDTPGVTFVSLQYTPGASGELESLRRSRGVQVAHWPEAIADHDETAALVTALDLTVSVCTAVVHLAGALGRPVWVMTPSNAEWRYGCTGDSMPWYPSARIYRQANAGDWSGVIAAVAVDLAEELGAERLNNIGIALVEQNSEREGERALRRALDLDPRLVAARENLAILLMQRFEHDAAVAAWRAVLALDPRRASAHAALGLLALRAGDIDAAREHNARALELGADRKIVLVQEAGALAGQGNVEEARRVLGSLSAEADPVAVDWQRALIELAEGEFEEGWRLFESRLARSGESPRRGYSFPEWDGKRVHGGALLVMAEQGVGDEIMFASCYPDAIVRAGQCAIECDPRLARLFARSFPDARVVPQRRPGLNPELATDASVAAQVHAGSLPGFFRTRLKDFPGDAYLRADAERVTEWRRRLHARRAIGIAWSGGLAHTGRALRSIGPERFAGLLALIPDAEFVSLQHDDDGSFADAIAAKSGMRVHRFSEVFADFDDMAALMCNLDCVLTVCSSVVHLAGALGVPAVVLAPCYAEWRYMRQGRRMPWYRSVRVVRQQQSGDWAPAFAEAVALLAASGWHDDAADNFTNGRR